MSAPVRFAIAGYGWVARSYIAPALRGLPNGRLVAVCDPDSAARAHARASGLEAYSDLTSLLARHDIDAVYVATPNDTHRALVIAAARAGKHVLCEKPMATTLEDAEAMLAACISSGALYETAFDQRFHPAHERLRAFVRAGDLGIVTGARLVYACWLDRFWSADNWRVDVRRSGGGALVDLAPHGLDLVATVLDDEIERAHALVQNRVHDYGVDDGAMIVARTRGGVLAQLHVAYNYPESLPRRRFELTGTRGIALATDTMGQVPGGTLEFTSATDGRTESIDFGDAARSPFSGLVAAFANAVQNGERLDAIRIAKERSAMRVLTTLLEAQSDMREATTWR